MGTLTEFLEKWLVWGRGGSASADTTPEGFVGPLFLSGENECWSH